MVRTGLWHPLSTQLRAGLPVLGTCAGLILLEQVEPSAGGRDPPTFGVLDIAVRRNDYGHQSESFEAPVRMDGLNGRPLPGVFIRSPRMVTRGAYGDPARVVRQRGRWRSTGLGLWPLFPPRVERRPAGPPEFSRVGASETSQEVKEEECHSQSSGDCRNHVGPTRRMLPGAPEDGDGSHQNETSRQ